MKSKTKFMAPLNLRISREDKQVFKSSKISLILHIPRCDSYHLLIVKTAGQSPSAWPATLGTSLLRDWPAKTGIDSLV